MGYPRLASHAEKECKVNMNKVVAGDYEGKAVAAGRNCVVISLSLFHTVSINKDEVSEYAVLNVKIVRKPRMLACAAAPEGGRGAWSRRAPRFAGQRGSALF